VLGIIPPGSSAAKPPIFFRIGLLFFAVGIADAIAGHEASPLVVGPGVSDAGKSEVPVQDPGVVVAIPAGTGVPEPRRRNLSLVVSADEVIGRIELRLRLYEGRRWIGRRSADGKLESGSDEEEAVIRLVCTNHVDLELEPRLLPPVTKLVREPQGRRLRVASGYDQAQIRRVGPSELRFLLTLGLIVLRVDVVETSGDDRHERYDQEGPTMRDTIETHFPPFLSSRKGAVAAG
jgi:hypothetical protein